MAPSGLGVPRALVLRPQCFVLRDTLLYHMLACLATLKEVWAHVPGGHSPQPISSLEGQPKAAWRQAQPRDPCEAWRVFRAFASSVFQVPPPHPRILRKPAFL